MLLLSRIDLYQKVYINVVSMFIRTDLIGSMFDTHVLQFLCACT